MMRKLTNKSIYLAICIFFFINQDTYSQGLNQDEFKLRRQQFMEKMEPGVAIFISPEVSQRNSDVDYKFRQNSDFYYLSGFDEPESAFILSPGSKHEFVMFVKANHPMSKMWTGGVCGINGAMEKYGADTAFQYNQFDDLINYFLRGKERIYYNMSNDDLNDRLFEVMNYPWGNFPKQLINTSDLIHSMRILKSPEEIKLMQKAIDISCDAHMEAMKFTKPGQFEYEVKALIEYVFAKNNCVRSGFPSIVASGPNATILHYEGQDREMKNGDLLLMDIGAEYEYYSADITRTIPVNGKFTDEQKTLYDIVLKAQDLGIKMLKKGVGIEKVVDSMTAFAGEELYKLGLITDKESAWQSRLWYFPYTCHWLGLDVHDVQGDVAVNEDGVILRAGMVTTIEPGLYINPENLTNLELILKAYRIQISSDELNEFIEKVQAPVQKYARIGIRIEDDVLITESGNEILSKKVPKTIKDIEKIMSQ